MKLIYLTALRRGLWEECTVFPQRSLAICVNLRAKKCDSLCVLQVQNLLRRITVVIPQQELEGMLEIGEKRCLNCVKIL